MIDDVTVLLDIGCERYYISSALVRKFEPRGIEYKMLSYAQFGSKGFGKGASRNMFYVDLISTDKDHPLLVTD